MKLADIVERLRDYAAEPWKHDGGSWPDRMREAADEVERLRGIADARAAANVAHCAEIERLRATLVTVLARIEISDDWSIGKDITEQAHRALEGK